MSDWKEDVQGVRLLVFGSCSVSVLGLPHILLWLKSKLRLRDVRVVLTPTATRLVTTDSIQRVAGCEVFVTWDDLPSDARSHVSLAEWPEVAIALPATANFIGKLANGIADDLATSVVMALSCPVIVVPATNATAWRKPAVQRNVNRLREDGFNVIDPVNGISVAGDTTEPGSMGDYRPALLRALMVAAGRTQPDRIFAEENAREVNVNR